MRNIFDLVFDLTKYETKIERVRASLVYGMILLLGVALAIYAISIPDWSDPDGGSASVAMIKAAAADPIGDAGISLIGMFLIAGLAFVINRRGLALIAAWGPFFMWFCTGVILTITTTNSPGDAGGPIILLSVIGGLLLGRDGIVASVVLSLSVLLLRWVGIEAYLDGEGTPSVPNVVMQVTVGSLIVYLFLRYTVIARIAAASDAVKSREVTGDILTEIASLVSQRPSLKALLSQIIQQINDQFDFIYHTQVFLIDEFDHQAQLVASTGDVGERLIAQSHALIVGSESVIGQVTLSGAHVVARVGERGSVHRQNDLLPQTRVEAAFPLRVGERIIGALDVQSVDSEAFSDETILLTFQALADSLTLAIDNVRQYERAEARLKENERLVVEMQDAVREVEHLNERLTGRAWSEYLGGGADELGIKLDFATGKSDSQGELTPASRQAIQQNSLVQDQHNEAQVIAIPLHVRGRVIGAMEFELEKDHEFSPEDYDLVQEVTERFGLAVENARLVDQSQRVAQREALVNQITARLQSANTVDAMVNEAARGLRDALKAGRVAIRLGAPTLENDASSNGATDDVKG
jgi:GAF domain-containing protein